MPAADDGTKASPKAPDGGWSWVVMACAFFNSVVISTIVVTFGIVFNEKLTAMDVSSTTMMWIYNIFNLNFNLVCMLCGPLSDVFSWRSVGFVSATITGVGYACMVFVTSPGLLFLLFSVVVGCSAGPGAIVGYLTIPHYFDLHRGRAGAIMMTGTSLGQVIIPLLMHHLLSEYGFAGACLIFSGLVFNSAALCLLLYPVDKRPLLKGDKMKKTPKRTQDISTSPKKKVVNPNRAEKLNGKRWESFQTAGENFKEIFTITWHHSCQMQHLTLSLVTLSFAFLVVGYGNFTALLPFAMAARGHSPASISYCLSIGALANTLVRVFVCWASDAHWFSRKIWFISGAALSGVSTLVTVFVLHDSQWIMVCQIFWGLGIGANLSVYFNLIIDTCGRELYDSAAAVTSLLMAVSNIILGPLTGLVRDYTSYEMGIGMTAAFQMMCAMLWIFMPLARRYDTRKFSDLQLPEKESEKASNLGTNEEAVVRKCPSGEINSAFQADADESPSTSSKL